MARKMTISVPEDLYERMAKWKGTFNFSSVFQKAVSAVIQKKEDFQERIQEELDQTAIVERLRQEKAESENDYFEQGKQDGLHWAKIAHYDDLQYALLWIPDDKPTQDKILGDYFADRIAADDIMDYAVGSDPVCVNEFVKTYLEGWKEGVGEFWEEVRERL
ncbi:MAG: hypothetical protein ACLFS7_00320 [Desulfosudaceae bacterium]